MGEGDREKWRGIATRLWQANECGCVWPSAVYGMNTVTCVRVTWCDIVAQAGTTQAIYRGCGAPDALR